MGDWVYQIDLYIAVFCFSFRLVRTVSNLWSSTSQAKGKTKQKKMSVGFFYTDDSFSYCF